MYVCIVCEHKEGYNIHVHVIEKVHVHVIE